MEHAKQVAIIKELFHQIDHKVNVDCGAQVVQSTTVYTDRNHACKEWQKLFGDHPQIIGFSGDLPGANSYFTLDDFGVPILATRDSKGKVRTFLNACRHRGVKVAQERRGNAARFVCPFHAWTYANSGELLRVRKEEHFGAVEKNCNSLVELPAAEACGILWVHPNPSGELHIDDLLGPLADELAAWNIGDLLYQAEKTIDMQLNWKLANDTFGETYHFSRLHQNTLGQLFYGDVLAYEEMGRNHRFVAAAKEIDKLRDQPESEWKLRGNALVLYYLFPNIQLAVNKAGVTLVRIYPDKYNPGRSISRINIYQKPEVVAALRNSNAVKVDASNAYDSQLRESTELISAEAALEVFSSTIEQEDYAMGEQTQRAAESGLLSEVTFGRNEPPLHHFHRCFAEVLGGGNSSEQLRLLTGDAP